MKKLDLQKITNRANFLYNEAKQQKLLIADDWGFEIHSDQVKSILKALVEAINESNS